MQEFDAPEAIYDRAAKARTLLRGLTYHQKGLLIFTVRLIVWTRCFKLSSKNFIRRANMRVRVVIAWFSSLLG